jgi:hypothetical protein
MIEFRTAGLEKSRYKSVTHTDNAIDGTRTVTVVEDLTKPPLTDPERYEQRRKEREESKEVRSPPRDLRRHIPPLPRATAATQPAPTAAPGTLHANVPLTDVPSPAPVAPPQHQIHNNKVASEETDIGTAPPPYTYHWTKYV